MRIFLIPSLLLAGLSACGPKPLTLPGDPIDRAATCGVVAAAAARQASKADVARPLSFADATHVFHYALLAASEGGSFDNDRAAAVVARGPALEPAITKGKWQELQQTCDTAFPAAARKDAAPLPADPFEARLECSALAGFLKRSMGAQDAAYGDALGKGSVMADRVSGAVAAGLAARGAKSFDAAKKLRDEAIAAAARRGPPAAVIDQCVAKYS